LERVLRKFESVGNWFCREFIAAWPVFIFFLVCFLLLLSIIKLALATFSIEVTAFSKAVVGALFAAKAVLILDETPLARHLQQYRRILAVAVKTFIYGAIALLLGFLERLLEARHRVDTFAAAAHYVIAQASLCRLLAWALGISLVFESTSPWVRSTSPWARARFGHCFASLPSLRRLPAAQASTRTLLEGTGGVEAWSAIGSTTWSDRSQIRSIQLRDQWWIWPFSALSICRTCGSSGSSS